MKLNATLTTLPLLAALAIASGCRSMNTTERAESYAAPSNVDLRHLETDPSLRNDVSLVAVNEQVLPDGTLKIQATVRNNTRSNERFNYRVEWFDESGMIVQTPSQVWRRASLRGGETMSITAVAPSPRAVDFRIKLIEGKQ